jgi:hypothetical protein
MKNSDEVLDRILTGLREAEASEGMNRRILEAVQDRAQEQGGWRPMWLMALSPSIGRRVWVTAAVGVVVFSMVFYWTSFRTRTRHESVVSKSQKAPASTTTREVQLTTEKVLSPLQLRQMQQSKRTIDLRKTERIQRGESTGQGAMHAVSYPAPEEPLTEEERLLLRIAHRGDPVEIAELNPVLRNARDEESKKEFQRFFEPQTIKANK